MQKKRSTLRLTPEAQDALEWLVEKRQVSLSEAIRRALATEKFIVELTDPNGRAGRIVVDIPGEQAREIVLI